MDIPNIGILIKQMNKLEWFEYCRDNKITKLESLCLPDSNITSLVFESCAFNDYSSIRKYKALKRLWILHSNFPRKLFVSVEDFPNLQEFIFLPRSMVYYNPRFCVEPQRQRIHILCWMIGWYFHQIWVFFKLMVI